MNTSQMCLDSHQKVITFSDVKKHYHTVQVSSGVPKGCIMWWDLRNGSIPSGWTVYTPLLGRYPLGNSSGKGEEVQAGLPNIYGTFDIWGQTQKSSHLTSEGFTGPFSLQTGSSRKGVSAQVDKNNAGLVTFNANAYNSIYGNSSTVTPPSCKLVPIIKE